MSTHTGIRVQTEAFDVAAVIDELRAGNPAVGAIARFIGLVRDVNDGEPVTTMTLEHYPGMTEKALHAIVVEAKERWDLIGVTVVHRVGELHPTDAIVLVAVASAHRGDAFLRVHYGFSQDAGALLEEGRKFPGGNVGRVPHQRHPGCRALENLIPTPGFPPQAAFPAYFVQCTKKS